jgi:hypothetical protein
VDPKIEPNFYIACYEKFSHLRSLSHWSLRKLLCRKHCVWVNTVFINPCCRMYPDCVISVKVNAVGTFNYTTLLYVEHKRLMTLTDINPLRIYTSSWYVCVIC